MHECVPGALAVMRCTTHCYLHRTHWSRDGSGVLRSDEIVLVVHVEEKASMPYALAITSHMVCFMFVSSSEIIAALHPQS